MPLQNKLNYVLRKDFEDKFKQKMHSEFMQYRIELFSDSERRKLGKKYEGADLYLGNYKLYCGRPTCMDCLSLLEDPRDSGDQ